MYLLLFLIPLFLPSILATDDYPDGPTGAPLISIGDAVEGYIDPGDLDYLKIQLVQGRTYRITLQALNPPSPDLDAQLFFYSSDGVTKLADNDDGDEGKNSRIVWTAAYTGYYYIVAKSFYPAHYGTYVFAAIDLNSCPTSCASLYFEEDFRLIFY